MIGIIDYGAGNLFSVQKALDYLDVDNRIILHGNEDWSVDGMILPGVGSFGFAMGQIRQKKLEQPLKKWLSSGKPFLGIRLGLQLLLESSEETAGCAGLGILPGISKKFTTGKVPQIGWNRVEFSGDHLLARGMESSPYFYFVHSYYAVPSQKKQIAGLSDYQVLYPSVLQSGHIWAVQFHPEKSGRNGLKLLKNWVDLC